jgi:hypothetical protein
MTSNPALTVCSVALTVYFLPIPPSSHCSVGGVLMVRSDYKTWVQTERFSVLTCCHTDLWLQCSSHLIVVISNNLASSLSPRKKARCLFQLGCPFAYSNYNYLLGCLKLLKVFPCPCLWATFMLSSLTTWPQQEPSYLSGLEPGDPPGLSWLSLAFFGHFSCSPTCPPDYNKNHLI